MRPSNITELINLLTDIISATIPVLIALAFLYFLWGLAQFMLHAGDTSKHEEGRDKIFWGLVALTAMVGVWGFVEIVANTFFF
ncbi:MAG: hypothetical protein WDZ90_00960 [Candidatus Paceibacterota bacterium]